MALGRLYEHQDCALARALEEVGERWTLLVLRDCLLGVRRFSELRDRLDIPRAMLASRLSALVEAGLLERRPYGAAREEYLPTDKAVALWPAIHALIEWGERFHPAPGGRRRLYRHVPCDRDVDRTGRCPRCDTVPAPGELETRPGPGADSNRREDRVSLALNEGPHRLLTPVYRTR
ncbi:MAG TPA: helix-turn-helix domain-containing protein [Pseudonocardia sp.]|jgi:DNA-binding HxlR family transcriptional regulator